MNTNSRTHSIVMCALFSALIAVGAFIKIPIPLVPFTLQFLFVNMAVLFLGKNYAVLSVAMYLLIGLIGLPIFSKGGGPSYIFQPTFGYLLGFLLGAFLSGLMLEHCKKKNLKTYMVASIINLSSVYLIGLTYFYFLTNYYLKTPFGAKALFIYCFAVFIPGDLTSSLLSSFLAIRLKKFIGIKSEIGAQKDKNISDAVIQVDSSPTSDNAKISDTTIQVDCSPTNDNAKISDTAIQVDSSPTNDSVNIADTAIQVDSSSTNDIK